ncbi:MAG TPA: sialate O-acetylesterase [Polyangia bacterium]
MAGLLGVGCGLQSHPTMVDTSSGGAPGSGGQSSGSGGQSSASGGAPGSGGQPSGSGGQPSASGGAPGSGGQSSGSGGQSSASGGAPGSGGQPSGSGGQSSASGGATGSGGTTSSGSGGTSGAGVMINGTFVPKEKAVVFIHFGHSNMRGQATKPSSLMSYFYNTENGLWSYNNNGFSLAKEPTAPEGTMTFAGPGMAILHSAKAAVAATSDVQFISIGFGRGSSTTVDYATNGTYYTTFMKWAGQLKGNVTFGAIVVMLGITDGEHLASNLVPAFPMRMAQILNQIRTDLGEPNLPVMFCDYEQMATGTLAPTGSVGVVMEPLVRMLPGMVSKLVLVPTDGLEMQDDHHFDMQGHKDWANRLVMLMQSNNWFPWK